MKQSVVVIPARAGEKQKGAWKLSGHTLVEWVLDKCAGWRCIVTSDIEALRDVTEDHEQVYVHRPYELSYEGSGLLEKSIIHACDTVGLPDSTIVHVCQPTSPFISRNSLLDAEAAFDRCSSVKSYQTISRVPHNFLDVNQRVTLGCGSHFTVNFVDPVGRKERRVKQSQARRWAFGTLVSTRLVTLRDTLWLFETPCAYGLVNRFDALDVDTQDDLMIAEAYVAYGLVAGFGESHAIA